MKPCNKPIWILQRGPRWRHCTMQIRNRVGDSQSWGVSFLPIFHESKVLDMSFRTRRAIFSGSNYIYIYYTNITRTFRKTTQSNIYCCDSNLPNFAWFVCVHCNNYNHACVQSTQLVCMCAATIEKLQGSQTLIEASRSAHSRALKNICFFFSPKWTRKFWSLKGSNDVFKVEVETFTAVGCLHGCMFQDEPRIKL